MRLTIASIGLLAMSAFPSLSWAQDGGGPPPSPGGPPPSPGGPRYRPPSSDAPQAPPANTTGSPAASSEETPKAPKATTKQPPAPGAKKEEAPPDYHDPAGSVLFGVSGGVSFVGDEQVGSVGLHGGYAIFTGLVPVLQGTYFFGAIEGGQVVSSLWLTPPLDAKLVPFGVGEVGYVWQNDGEVRTRGFFYGAGGGLHLGRRTDRFGLRAGVVYRIYDFEGAQGGFFSPLLIGSVRL